jgi:hexosaminidase
MLFTLATPQTSNPLVSPPSGPEIYDTGDEILNPAHPAHTPAIPPGVDLVYWDYYHTDPEAYRHRIREHSALCHGKLPWVATGIWNWNRMWTSLGFTMRCVSACMKACQAEGVQNVFVTIWGDDANECDT